MRKLGDMMSYKEWDLIRDCKYQEPFPCMNGNGIYVCCTRNLDDEKRKVFSAKYVNICSDCIGSSCKYKENR